MEQVKVLIGGLSLETTEECSQKCNMDSEQGKVLIDGLSFQTTEERLKDYFKTFGDVSEAVIMKDRLTGRPQDFGFLVFADPAVADRLLLDSKHNIDGRMVEVKKVDSRDQQHSITRSSGNTIRNGGQSQRTKKICVRCSEASVTENELRKYFEQFGAITRVVIMSDPKTQTPRGIGCITFKSQDAVDSAVQNPFHELNGKMVEVTELPTAHIRFPAGRGGNFGASNGHVFNSTAPLRGYVPPLNATYGTKLGGAGGNSSYGPVGYYGTGPVLGRLGGGYSSYGPVGYYGTGSVLGRIGGGYSSYGPVGYYGTGPVLGRIGGGYSSYGPVGYYGTGPVLTGGNNILSNETRNGSMRGALTMASGKTGSSIGNGGPGSGDKRHPVVAQVDDGQSNGSSTAGHAAQDNVGGHTI